MGRAASISPAFIFLYLLESETGGIVKAFLGHSEQGAAERDPRSDIYTNVAQTAFVSRSFDDPFGHEKIKLQDAVTPWSFQWHYCAVKEKVPAGWNLRFRVPSSTAALTGIHQFNGSLAQHAIRRLFGRGPLARGRASLLPGVKY